MKFDYFYGEESEQFSFFRIPRQLISGEKFRQVSTDAKLLYGILLDRMELSRSNGWYDDQGRVFIFYPLEEIMETLNCAHGKAVKLLAELDTSKGIGLIERVKQGLGRPTIIYVKQFVTRDLPPETPGLPNSGNPDFRKSEVKTSHNRQSGLPKIGSKLYLYIYTDRTKPIYLSITGRWIDGRKNTTMLYRSLWT